MPNRSGRSRALVWDRQLTSQPTSCCLVVGGVGTEQGVGAQYEGAVFVTRPFVATVIAGILRGAVFADRDRNEVEKLVRGEPLNVVPESLSRES